VTWVSLLAIKPNLASSSGLAKGLGQSIKEFKKATKDEEESTEAKKKPETKGPDTSA